jgi:hypothetical protein
MAITNGYATLSQVKAALRITDAVDDSLLEMAVESASRLIDGYTERSFYSGGTAATTRYYHTQDPYVVQTDDFRTLTSLKTSSNADGVYDIVWAADDYQVEPLNDFHGGLPWPHTRIRAVGDYTFPSTPETTVEVTAVFGWPNIPTTLTQATVIQASRIFKRLDSPLGVAGFGDVGVMRVSSSLDPDVRMLVEPYRRMRGVA